MSERRIGLLGKALLLGIVAAGCNDSSGVITNSDQVHDLAREPQVTDIVRHAEVESSLLEDLNVSLLSPSEVDPSMFMLSPDNPELWVNDSSAMRLKGRGDNIVVSSERYTEEGVMAALFDINGAKLLETPVGSSIADFDAEEGIAVIWRHVQGVEGATHAVQIVDYKNQQVYEVNIPEGYRYSDAFIDEASKKIVFSFAQQEFESNLHYDLLRARKGTPDGEPAWAPDLYNENFVIGYPDGQTELEVYRFWSQGQVLSVGDGIVGIEYPVIPDVLGGDHRAAMNQMIYGMAPFAATEMIYLSLTQGAQDPFLRVPSGFREEDVPTKGSGLIFSPGASAVGEDYIIGFGRYFIIPGSPPLPGLFLTENKTGGQIYELSSISLRTYNRNTGEEDYFELPRQTSIDGALNNFAFTQEGELVIIADNGRIYLLKPETLAALSLGNRPEEDEQPAILDVGAAFYKHSNIPGSSNSQRY